MENKFKDWLDSKGIPYTIPDDCIDCVNLDDYLLRPYESELKELLPEIEFVWNVVPKHHED